MKSTVGNAYVILRSITTATCGESGKWEARSLSVPCSRDSASIAERERGQGGGRGARKLYFW